VLLAGDQLHFLEHDGVYIVGVCGGEGQSCRVAGERELDDATCLQDRQLAFNRVVRDAALPADRLHIQQLSRTPGTQADEKGSGRCRQ
jgi:hypothetical protein